MRKALFQNINKFPHLISHFSKKKQKNSKTAKLAMTYFLQPLSHLGDFKNNASISLINVYRLYKADLLLKLILGYVINVYLASCQVSSL